MDVRSNSLIILEIEKNEINIPCYFLEWNTSILPSWDFPDDTSEGDSTGSIFALVVLLVRYRLFDLRILSV